jgi:hypothetical protein
VRRPPLPLLVGFGVLLPLPGILLFAAAASLLAPMAAAAAAAAAVAAAPSAFACRSSVSGGDRDISQLPCKSDKALPRRYRATATYI